MNPRKPPLLAILFLLPLAMMGCETPHHQYQNQNLEFIENVDDLNSLRAMDRIDDQTWNTTVIPKIESGDSILVSYWNAVLMSGETDYYFRRIQTINNELKLIRREVKRGPENSSNIGNGNHGTGIEIAEDDSRISSGCGTGEQATERIRCEIEIAEKQGLNHAPDFPLCDWLANRQHSFE